MRTDEDLMTAYVEGDVRALDVLHTRYRAFLLASMRRRLGSPSDAEDVVQQTFLRLHIARATYRTGEPFRPWLLTIAHNVRRDHARTRARHPEHELDPELTEGPSDTLRALERAESVSLLRRALQRLTPPLRTTVEMHWLEDRAFDEVARLSGLRQGTVRVRAHRACAQLRAIFTEEPALADVEIA